MDDGLDSGSGVGRPKESTSPLIAIGGSNVCGELSEPGALATGAARSRGPAKLIANAAARIKLTSVAPRLAQRTAPARCGPSRAQTMAAAVGITSNHTSTFSIRLTPKSFLSAMIYRLTFASFLRALNDESGSVRRER